MAQDERVAGLATTLQQARERHQAGNLDAAETLYRQVLATDPRQPDALQLLGLIAHQVGQHAAAVQLIVQALEIQPANADAHNNLGNALHALGEMDEAIASYRTALALQPSFVQAQRNLALMLRRSGRLAEAVDAYRALAQQDAASADAQFELGVAWHQLGQREEAMASYQRAIALRSEHSAAHHNLGVALRELGRSAEAIASYREALRHRGDYPQASNHLALALGDLNLFDEAIAIYRSVLERHPDYGEAWHNLAGAMHDAGDVDEALRCLDRAAALGVAGARVRAALMLPPIMGTRDEMLASRECYAAGVQSLLASELRIDDPLRQVGATSFYLAYHGMDDCELQALTAAMHLRLCPSLGAVAPHVERGLRIGRRRVGFLSRYLYNHSVSKCFSRVVTELGRQGDFEVVLISTHAVDEAQAQRQYAGFTGARLRLPHDLAAARGLIAELALDVLLYLDVGMDPLSYFLAFARLAPRQIVIGGHPVTTGIAAIDEFVTADLMEPPDAASHYTEALLRTPTGVFYFERPVVPSVLKTRAELGLPPSGHLYLCPMMLQKIHPDFDAAVERILQLDIEGHVVFFEDPARPQRHRQLAARFDRTIDAAVRSRVVFLPWIHDYDDFIAVNAACDVVLDPFHFGVGSTLIATFAVRAAIVTWPGTFMRGRVGLGFCRMLDIPDCVAESQAAYPALAVRLAGDRVLRARVSEQISRNDHRIYDNLEPIRALATALAR